MASPKVATVVAARPLGPETRLLDLAFAAPLGFVGGQYIIVNSGVVLDGGKLAKRAYSLLSPDADQERAQLAVQRVGAGPASSFLHAAAVGSEFEFSGPWGKLLPDDSRPRPTWVIASDTGITAALGLVRGWQFRPQRPYTRLAWLRPDGYFLPPALVHEAAGVEVELVPFPPIGHPERAAAAVAWLAPRLADAAPASLFLSGDGLVVHALRAAAEGAGVAREAIRVECFFNNPDKKAA